MSCSAVKPTDVVEEHNAVSSKIKPSKKAATSRWEQYIPWKQWWSLLN
jgi:hypothetical protein